MKFPVFPDEASTTAAPVDHLYFFLIVFSAGALLIIFLPMLFFLFRYRRGHRANRSPLRISTWKIEATWTAIPLLLTMGIFAWGARVYFDLEVPPQGTLEINVVGKQWMWKIEHQEGNQYINDLHLPVGLAVKITLASADVIHSFFIPAFRVKQDVVPGRYTTEWFTPAKAGDFHIFCAQYCGAGHSQMIGTVHVLERRKYQAWLATEAVTNTLSRSPVGNSFAPWAAAVAATWEIPSAPRAAVGGPLHPAGTAGKRPGGSGGRQIHTRLHPAAGITAGGRLSAADALLSRADFGGGTFSTRRLHQEPGKPAAGGTKDQPTRARTLMEILKPTVIAPGVETSSAAVAREENYLNAAHTVKSWLFTTDHKRIGILYLVSITGYFFLAAGREAR